MSKARILVIEDNLDNYDLVQFLLSQEGYEVLGAANGRTGGEMVREIRPDLVLLDLSLPQISGWELASSLKSDPETANVPILALTGHTLPGDREKALAAGCDGYISKPIDINEFIEQVKEFINHR